MITHNATFETLATAPVKQTDVIVAKQVTDVSGYIDATPIWKSSDILMQVKIDAVGEMLGTVTKKAVVDLLGIVTTVKAGDIFQIRSGIYGTSAFTYISQGFFIVDSVEYDYEASSTTVNLYDAMWTAGKTLYSDVVVSSAITYPTTVQTLATYIASLLGVSLSSNFSSLPNSQFTIAEDLYSTISGATLQNALQDLAGATGTTVRMSDATLTFSPYSPTTESLDSSTLRTLKLGDTYGPITSVVLGRVPQNDNVALSASPPFTSTVTNVDTTNNLLTIATHAMSNGNMVQISSTGSLPAPLQPSTNYYVYTTAADTFSLVPSYLQAVTPQYALDFSGGSKYVTIPNLNSATMSVHFKVKFGTTGKNLFSNMFTLIRTGTNTITWWPNANLQSFTLSAPNIGNGNWHDLVLVHSGTTTTVYVDGAQTDSQTTLAISTTPNSAYLGRYSGTSDFDGAIKTFRMWSAALSSSEAIGLSSGTVPQTTSMNTEYLIANPTGTTATNTGTSGVAGTISGATRVEVRTSIIDLTTVGSGVITIPSLATKEIQINNNQIVDNDRATALPVLFDKLSGIYWTDIRADTIGLGWHEVGDVINFVQGTKTARAFLSEIHLVFDGSIKESLVSTIPQVAAIDYKTAGGVLKSIYNTEIKVDKQANQITSIVSRQDTIDGEINSNFTSITQDVDDVMLTVQKSGGGNLLLNSVGYAKEQLADANGTNFARLVSWDYSGFTGSTFSPYAVATHGTVMSTDSSESQNYGGISGRVIQMSSNYLASPIRGVQIVQRVKVAVGTPLSFGMRVRNALGRGDALVKLSNTNDTFYAYIDDTVGYLWAEVSKEDFVTTMPWLDITIQSNSDNFTFTDLRLLYGNTLRGWVQSNAEILSTNVQFTSEGMRIFDDNHDTETRVSYNEFSTVRRTDGVTLFEANDTGVSTNDLQINGTTSYNSGGGSIIKRITIPSDNIRAGIAFVRGS